MVVEVRVEMLLIEVVDERCPALQDMAITEQFSDHRAVIAFCQGVIVAVPGMRFEELDAQFFQQFGNPFVDVF